jgi:hypothetical protein
MPLLAAFLISELRKTVDPNFGGFLGFPQNDPDTAERWADAYYQYMLTISYPALNPLSIAGLIAAKEAMRVALAGMSLPLGAIALFPIAFAAFASTFAASTAPTYLSVPPPAALVLPFTLTPDGLVAATAIGEAIDLWTKTGTSAVVAPPGPVTPWS